MSGAGRDPDTPSTAGEDAYFVQHHQHHPDPHTALSDGSNELHEETLNSNATGSQTGRRSGSGSSEDRYQTPLSLHRSGSTASTQPPEYLSRSRLGSYASVDNQGQHSYPLHHGAPLAAHDPDRYCDARSDSPTIEMATPGRAQGQQGLHFAPDVKAPLGSATSPNPGVMGMTSDSEMDTAQDDYNWDTDEDIEGVARYEDIAGRDKPHHHRRKAAARRFSPFNIGKFLAVTFIGNVILSIVLLSPPLILRFAGYWQSGDSEHAIHTRYVYDNIAAWLYWASFNNMAAWGLHFIVELLPKIFVLLVHLIWGDVNESIKSRVEIYHAAKQWLKPPVYGAMLWGSWALIFEHIFKLRDSNDPEHASRAQYTFRVYQVVVLVFFLILVLSIEKLALLAISMNFHRVAYADRIKKVATALAVLDKLKDYRPKAKKAARPSSAHMGATSRGVFATGPQLVQAPPPSKSKWWQRKRQDAQEVELAARAGKPDPRTFNGPQPPPTPLLNSRASTAEGAVPTISSMGGDNLRRHNSDAASSFGRTLAKRGATAAQIARAAMKDPVSTIGRKSGLGLDINSPAQAKRLAKVIYFSFKADPNRKFLLPSDFYPAFHTEQAAKDAFGLFDSDGNGDISRSEIKNYVMQVYKERRDLARSLNDTGHAIKRLDGIMIGFGFIIMIFIALSVFGVDYSKAFTSVYTIGIAAAFIFKETAGNVFDAIIMVFCTHPYDTGDRIFMDHGGVQEVLVVKRIGLLVTLFERWDGTEWFTSNSTIGQKFITNLRRSDPQFENATIQIAWDTPLHKLTQLEEQMNLWLSTDEERRFGPTTACVIQHFSNMQYMEITVGMLHRENWQDWGARWVRRTAFHAALNHYTRELGISYYNASQPIVYRPSDLDKLPEYDPQDDQAGGSAVEFERSPLSPGGGADDEVEAEEGEDERQRNPAPQYMGFAPPLEGMRRRKKMSRRKMMAGDA